MCQSYWHTMNRMTIKHAWHVQLVPHMQVRALVAHLQAFDEGVQERLSKAVQHHQCRVVAADNAAAFDPARQPARRRRSELARQPSLVSIVHIADVAVRRHVQQLRQDPAAHPAQFPCSC